MYGHTIFSKIINELGSLLYHLFSKPLLSKEDNKEIKQRNDKLKNDTKEINGINFNFAKLGQFIINRQDFAKERVITKKKLFLIIIDQDNNILCEENGQLLLTNHITQDKVPQIFFEKDDEILVELSNQGFNNLIFKQLFV